MDVKAEHYERQVTRLEQERDQWEKKYEVHPILLIALPACFPSPPDRNSRLQDAQEKYRESKRELDELVSSMEGL